MSAYYSENDPHAAAWLRELIKAGEIAAGDVDDRSILDVSPADLSGYTQAHFFAGIGGWSLALRLAGWPDTRPIWTGSCPCQPFSAAGAGHGGVDERHLWPAWFDLISRCRPPVVAGEQVEAAISHGWLDLVCDDLEGVGYAVAPVGLPAACVGAPHIRQRIWFLAESDRGRPLATLDAEQFSAGMGPQQLARPGRATGLVADGDATGRGVEWFPALRGNGLTPRRDDVDGCGTADQLGSPNWSRLQRRECAELPGTQRDDEGRATGQPSRAPWADLDWLPCRDGKSRPTQSGLQPLAHGVPARVGRLRGYGNAIVPQVAAEVIRAYLEVA